jgi:hypothetical protein
LYIIADVNDNDIFEFWELLMIIKYVEPQHYNLETLLQIWYENADVYMGVDSFPCMSIQKFSIICLIRQWLSKESLGDYQGRHNLWDLSDEKEFCKSYLEKNQKRLFSIFEKTNISYICHAKILKKIEFAIYNEYFCSFKAIKSTYTMILCEANSLEADREIHDNLFPLEYECILEQQRKLEFRMIEECLAKTVVKLQSEIKKNDNDA